MEKKVLIFCVLTGVLFIAFAAMKNHYSIDPAVCTACGACAEICPEEAISPADVDGKTVYVIDPAKCTACGACSEVCPEGAISPDSSDVAVEGIKKKSKNGGTAK